MPGHKPVDACVDGAGQKLCRAGRECRAARVRVVQRARSRTRESSVSRCSSLTALRLAAFHRDRVCAKAVRVPRTLSCRFEILVLSGAGDPWVWSSPGTLSCTPLGSLAMAGCPAGAGSLRVLDTVLCFSAQLGLQTPVCMPGAFSCGREWRVLL